MNFKIAKLCQIQMTRIKFATKSFTQNHYNFEVCV